MTVRQQGKKSQLTVDRKITGSASFSRVSVLLAKHELPWDQAHVLRTQLHTMIMVPGKEACLEISIDSLVLAEDHLDRPTLLGDVLDLLSDKDSPMAYHLTRCMFRFNATIAKYPWEEGEHQRLRRFWCVVLLAVWYDAVQEKEKQELKRNKRRDIRRHAAKALYHQ